MAVNRLAGNPIIIPIYTGANLTGRYRIYAAGILIYEGTAFSISGTAEVDVSELFEGLKNTAGITPAYMVTVDDEGAEYDPQPEEPNSTNYYALNVYGGAIGDIMARKIANAGNNIFAGKLKNATNNFLLTTRSNSRLICIPETELDYIHYYRGGLNFQITTDGMWIASFDHTNDAEALVSLDMAQLRKDVFLNNEKLVSHFDFSVDQDYSFTIVITPAAQATAHIKFRNSWGVDELIAIEGDMTFEPELSEQKTVQSYDSVVKRMVDRTQRKSYKSVYTANLGYRDTDGRLFVLDALMSDTVKLIVNGVEYDCKLSADAQTFDTTTGEPLLLTVRIELTDLSLAACNLRDYADISGGTLDDEPEIITTEGVFDDTFDDTFN